MNDEIELKINNFVKKPNLASTYKIVLFKAILEWCKEKETSDTLLLSLEFIAKYFIKSYVSFYQHKELHHLTNKKKTIEFFNLFEKEGIKDQDDLTDEIFSRILDDAKKIILQDVNYRFRNTCNIYDFIQLKESKLEILQTSEKIQEDEYSKIKSNISYIKFTKEVINWLRRNEVLLEKTLNYLLLEFLYNLNLNNPNVIGKLMNLI